MSLLDNVRQTLSDVTGTVVEQSKQLSAQTQLQVAIKKLQLERAKRIHELGKQTYDWYKTGQLVVTGQVPSGISELCRQLDDIEHQVRDAESQMEQIRIQAMQNPQPSGTPHSQIIVTTPGTTASGTTANDAATAQPAPGAAVATPPPPVSHDTQVLGENDPNNASRPGPGPGA